MEQLRGKKVVVTGGAGFIGSHLVDALVKIGCAVTVIDNLETGSRKNLESVQDAVTFIEGSILDAPLLEKTFSDASAVFHQAALASVPKSIERPIETHEANATGTVAVFQAARKSGVRRVVYASSSSVYGDSPILPKIETMPTAPLSPYAAQKMMGEVYGGIFHNLFGLETVGLRYFNVFGPRQDPNSPYAAVIPKFIQAIRKGISPTIYGDGTASRDFTYIENVVAANIQAATVEGVGGSIYNIAAGDQITLTTLVEKINSQLGKSIKAEFADTRPGDIRHSFADISKAKDELGYAPAVGFDDGLARTIEAL